MSAPFRWDEASDWTLDRIIGYFESTSEDSWAVDVVRTQTGRNCIFGHLHAMGGGDEEMGGSHLMDYFEEAFCTTWRMYEVNDGHLPEYQQSTPRQRCLAYLYNLRDGKELTTYEAMDRDARRVIS